MLPTRARVRTRSDHELVARRGRRSARGPLVVHCLIRPEVAEPPRAGFITGRRVGPAVTRNRVRRRLQHLVAARLETLPAGTLLVVRALPGSSELDSRQLDAALDAALASVLRPAHSPGGVSSRSRRPHRTTPASPPVERPLS